jgi:hypothetical protein
MAARSKGKRPDALKRDKNEPLEVLEVQYDVPENMTVAETEDWVSGDKVRAQAALDEERKRKEPRSSLVTSLERLANDETGAGIGSGEA